MATAAGRITSTNVTPGMKLRVEVPADPWQGAIDATPGHVPINPTRRKTGPVATVTDVHRVQAQSHTWHNVRQTRIVIVTDIGAMSVAPAQTQQLAV